LEIIEVSGYTIEEKLEIAKRHLLPKQISEHGLSKSNVKLNKQALEKVVEEYTRESGVRSLEKTLAKLVRNRAKFVAMDEPKAANISTDDLEDILGPPRVQKDRYVDNEFAGVVTGLAWTQVGGDILFIESSLSRGKGKLTLTGNLGDVMKESAVIALEYLKAHADKLGLKPDIFDNWNLHIHVPEGATPKDGPSAGITIFTALASLYTQRKVREKLAMTGEITLRGKVLPVGGIKEKILAAKRARIKEIVLCADNRKDVEEIEQDYLKGLTFHYVKNMDEVMERALLKQKVKNPLTLN
jgi:ATP-dependent Lon protease